jgi:hypothetical protein
MDRVPDDLLAHGQSISREEIVKTRIVVIGGGITGQLVRYVVPDAMVCDWNQERRTARPLTRSYGANYLWHPIPGIAYRSFPVVTHVDGVPASEESVRAYKAKIGKVEDVVQWRKQFAPVSVGYDFEEFPDVTVAYDHRVVAIDRFKHQITFAKQGVMEYDILVSTIPLYTLLSMAGMDDPPGRLQFKPIFFRVTRRPPEAPFPPTTMYVNYLSDPNIGPYRFCDREGERHYESIVPFDGPPTKRFIPGKIYPHAGVPDVLDLLEGFNIYTFGRFGSWAPDELVHDTYEHIAQWKENMAL